MRHGYEERFDSLSNFVSKTKTAKMDLDYWQFILNGADMDALGVSQTNSASSTAGCYVCRDKERIASLDSSMIGTLASGEKECAVGLAIANDSGTALQNLKVTFDTVQRSSNANSATYAFEWRISDSETSIAAGSDWNQVSVPQTAPVTSAERSVIAEYRHCRGDSGEVVGGEGLADSLAASCDDQRTDDGDRQRADCIRQVRRILPAHQVARSQNLTST